MERRIYKFELPAEDHVNVEMPAGAQVLSVHEQYGKMCLWALVDPSQNQTKKRSFRVVGTGHSMEYTDSLKFIGTVFLFEGTLVFHIFEFEH